MKKILLFNLFIFNAVIAFSQLTIKVKTIPANTPIEDKIHIAGTFNNWNPSDTAMILKKQTDGSYLIVLTPSVGTHKFKFTRGSWATVEGTAQGGFVPDRVLDYNGTATTVELNIAGWEGQSNQTSTAAANVKIISNTFQIPQLGRTRRVWIYLPPQYQTDSTKRFPVLYMQDGQNLFDKTTSFSGEWEVDETLNRLAQQGDKGCIVVGIDNGGASRLNEYSPWMNARYGGGEGTLYAKFMVETLKPYIDAQFRTKPDRLNTAVGGSSMGGLIAMYAAVEYQDVFSKALIFSPAFWFNDSSYTHVVLKGNRQPMRYYLLAGQLEDNGSVVQDLNKMEKMFLGIGLMTKINYLIVPKADGQHTEWFWAREFGDAYKWLFAENTTSVTENGAQQEGVDVSDKIKIFPNPTDSVLNLETSENLKYVNLLIYDILGRLMHIQPYKKSDINVNYLKSGSYVLMGMKGKTVLFSKKFIKT